MDIPPTTWEGSPSEPSIEERIARVARGQLRLITARQLAAVGLSANAIHNRARRGRLHRLHFGVYATHPPPYAREQGWFAAVLAYGPGSLLSDWPAAAHWGVAATVPTLAPHVSVPGDRGRSRPGITVHLRGPIDPRDIRRKDGVPITSVDLVLVHLSPHLDAAELETMLVAAESLRLLKRGRLRELIEERRGRPGVAKLQALLALEPALVRSDLELLFLPIQRAARVDRPLVNHPIRVPGRAEPLTVDFAWPNLRLVVEADSQRFHGDWERAEADRERDQLLALAGWTCHRFVRRRLVEDPDGSAVRLRALIEVRRAELRG